MIIELALIGIFVGVISGFFGVGGGMILVPLLMLIGFDIKAAIGISVVQMVFSSIYGSYLNYKKGNLVLHEGMWVGVGGLFGGIIGARFTDLLDEQTLSYVFLALILFAIYRVSRAKRKNLNQGKADLSAMVLLTIGFIIGIVAMMLGVGGAILLTPILVGILHFSSKKAATAGLFFVVFSSLAGLGYKLAAGTFVDLSLDITTILSVVIAALVGAWVGIWLKEKVQDQHHKRYLIALYFVVLTILLDKIFLH
ncbi:MAG: sulfite exporter TauE/SafE family protein [Sulfurovum sp.]|nr:sulfite exporter TauE/SafE family protein [Sulfurovum sp.]